MKVLILYAHPEPTSSSGALKGAAVQTLEGAGHEVRVIDLYATGFDPVLKPQAFAAGRLDPARLDVSRAQTHAVEQGTQAEGAVAAQATLAWSDLLILQFPMWRYGMPAVMKGWFDRVLARSFAYAPGRKYDTASGGCRRFQALAGPRPCERHRFVRQCRAVAQSLQALDQELAAALDVRVQQPNRTICLPFPA